MASPLSEAHIEAQRRLRVAVSSAVAFVWDGLPNYDEESVQPFLETAAPVVVAGQQHSVNLTNAYIARMRRRAPLVLDMRTLVGPAVRNGVDPRDQWRRPFVQVWSMLQKGTPWAEATVSGRGRATEMAETDVQLSMRAASNAIGEQDDGIFGFIRVADGNACAYCLEIDGAYTKFADAAPLHPSCGCGLEPLDAPHPRAAKLPSGVAVHDHGELGPIIGAADHAFTTPSDLNL